MLELEPRLTRKCEFKWDPYPNTLRVTKIMGQARRVAWVGVNKVAKVPRHSELENGPHEPNFDPTTAKLRGVDLAHVEDIWGEASSDEDTTETGRYYRNEDEARLVMGSEREPLPVLGSMEAAICEEIRCDPIEESKPEKPEKCKTFLISTVRVDLASEDTDMEFRDDMLPLMVQEPCQEQITSNVVSGLELMLRSNDNQIQLLDSPECTGVSPLFCVPLAIIDPLDQGVVAPGITPIKGNAHSK